MVISCFASPLIKYGYSNFLLEILQYCYKSEVYAREEYFLELLPSDYNILKIAGSYDGYKLSKEAKVKIKSRT